MTVPEDHAREGDGEQGVRDGARRDLGRYDAAVAPQVLELKDRCLRPWSVRLFYAHADAPAAVGRQEEAKDRSSPRSGLEPVPRLLKESANR